MKSTQKPSKCHEKVGGSYGGGDALPNGNRERLQKLRETASESDESNKIQKTKHPCIVEAHESTRNRLESTLSQDHEDHIAEKGFKSIRHFSLVHKIYSDAPAL